MITRRDLDEQIEHIQSKSNQTPDECIRLAAYYTIRDHSDSVEFPTGYSASAPVSIETEEAIIGDYGDSEFLQIVSGKDAAHVWAVIDEVMSTLKVMEPRLYAGVLRKINH